MDIEDENPSVQQEAGFASTARKTGFSVPWVIDAMAMDLIDTPLDFLFAEHHRQRQAARILLRIADGEFNPAGVANLVEFLEVDFARHIDDEERGLFPVMRQHCAPEDNIDRLIGRLTDEHKNENQLAGKAMRIIKGLLTGGKLAVGQHATLRAFAERIRQHLAVENAVLLPIAGIRLDESALQNLSQTLKQHRNAVD